MDRDIIIIPQGDVAMWQVQSNRPDFDPETMDFRLEVIYGLKGKMLTLQKSDFHNEGDGWFSFEFPTDKMVGFLVFRMVMQTASDSGTCQKVDEQEITFVTATPCTHLQPHIGCASREPGVIYQYIPIDGETPLRVVLRDSEGKFLRDSEKNLLRALKQQIL